MRIKHSRCAECPYKRGLIRTFANPCPRCKLTDYRTYELFQKIRLNDSAQGNKQDCIHVKLSGVDEGIGSLLNRLRMVRGGHDET